MNSNNSIALAAGGNLESRSDSHSTGRGLRAAGRGERNLSLVDEDFIAPYIVSCSEEQEPVVSELQARLARAEQELERLHQVKENQERLWASVLHDIRSPLNVILVCSQVVCDASVRPERRQRNAQLLQDAATAINTLCQDVLDFSKLSAGQMELSNQLFHLGDCVQNIIEGLQLVARKKGIDIRSFIAPDCPAKLMGDPGRLRQVLVNLLSNSIKFTQQGTVDVRVTRQIESSSCSHDVRLLFEVRDTGMGIHENKLRDIFDPFSQAHGRLSSDLGGAGLGLAISRKLVQCMGGEIRASSRPGRGTCLEFEARFGAAEEASVDKDTTLKARRILILDETPETQADLESACLALGMHPVLTSDGVEAVRLLEEAEDKGCPFPLAIVNLESGGGDVLFIVEQIHPDRRRNTRFLAFTLQGQRGDALRCQEAGVHGYLTGPVEQDSLEKILLDLTAQEVPECFVTRHSARQSMNIEESP